MDIVTFSGAASIAVACTLVFILAAKSWQIVSRAVGSSPGFAEGVMREAAQRFRDELERLSNRQSILLGAAVVFVVLFAAAYVLNAGRLFAGYPLWQLYIFLATLFAGAFLAAERLLRTVIDYRRVRLLRDANIATGHLLQRISAGFGTVYHDVETSAGTIDHVVIGRKGAYAVQVFARRRSETAAVTLDNNRLTFEAAGATETLVGAAARTAALEREFRRLLDHRVPVRSVIAVPGWQVTEPASEEHLLVNEANLATFLDWCDESEQLAEADVSALHTLLTARCSLTTQ